MGGVKTGVEKLQGTLIMNEKKVYSFIDCALICTMLDAICNVLLT